MFTLAQILGAMAQSLGMNQDALEKTLIDNLSKLDEGVQDVCTRLGSLSSGLAAAPGGSGQPGGTAAAGLISPAVMAALPPLQTLDSALSDMLVKLKPGTELLLQLRDAAEEAASGNEALTASLGAMAVAASGISNLMSGLRADGGPRRALSEAEGLPTLTGEETQRDISGAAAAQEPLTPIYYMAPQGAPTSDGARPGAMPVYPLRAPNEAKNNPALAELYSKPQDPVLIDVTAVQILGYLARFEPILIGIDAKCEEILRSINDESISDHISKGVETSTMTNIIAPAAGAPGSIIAGIYGMLASIFLDQKRLVEMINEINKMRHKDGKYAFPSEAILELTIPISIAPKDEKSKTHQQDPEHEHSHIPPVSSIEAIPPSTVSNITNNSYDNTTNNNQYYQGTLVKHDFDQISFNRCLDNAMVKLVRDVESGMRTC